MPPTFRASHGVHGPPGVTPLQGLHNCLPKFPQSSHWVWGDDFRLFSLGQWERRGVRERWRLRLLSAVNPQALSAVVLRMIVAAIEGSSAPP